MAKLHQAAGMDGAAMELHPGRSDHAKMKRLVDNFNSESLDAANGVKMTPLIDIVFQLIIFLMCAAHFRSLESKLDTVLPINEEINKPLLGAKQIVIALIHNDRNQMAPAIKLDDKSIAGYEELTRHLNNIRQSGAEISVTVDPQAQVPAQCVVDAINACQKAGVTPKLAK